MTLEPLVAAVPPRVPTHYDVDSVTLIAVATLYDANGVAMEYKQAEVSLSDLPAGPVRDKAMDLARRILKTGGIAL